MHISNFPIIHVTLAQFASLHLDPPRDCLKIGRLVISVHFLLHSLRCDVVTLWPLLGWCSSVLLLYIHKRFLDNSKKCIRVYLLWGSTTYYTCCCFIYSYLYFIIYISCCCCVSADKKTDNWKYCTWSLIPGGLICTLFFHVCLLSDTDTAQLLQQHFDEQCRRWISVQDCSEALYRRHIRRRVRSSSKHSHNNIHSNLSKARALVFGEKWDLAWPQFEYVYAIGTLIAGVFLRITYPWISQKSTPFPPPFWSWI